MNDNYCFSVGCIVRKINQVLLVRHTAVQRGSGCKRSF